MLYYLFQNQLILIKKKDFYNTEISRLLIEPLDKKVTKKSFEILNNISIEDIYKLATTSKIKNLKKKVDFVI